MKKKNYLHFLGILVLILLGVALAWNNKPNHAEANFGPFTNPMEATGTSDTLSLTSSTVLSSGKYLWNFTLTNPSGNRSSTKVERFTIQPNCDLSSVRNSDITFPPGWNGGVDAANNVIRWETRASDYQPILPGDSRTFTFIFNRDADKQVDNGSSALAGPYGFSGKNIGCTNLIPPPPPTSLQCPVSAGGNLAVVTFNTDDSNPLVTNKTAAEATTDAKPIVGGPLNNAANAGSSYNVTLYSFDNQRRVVFDSNQRYYLILKDSNGNTVYTSGPSDDIPDASNTQQPPRMYPNQIINNASQAVAKHLEPIPDPIGLPQSVVPVCASFEYVPPVTSPPQPTTGKVIFNTDVWFGDTGITDGDSLKIGPQALVLSSKDSTVPSDSHKITNFSLPCGGDASCSSELSWHTLEHFVQARYIRFLQSFPDIKVSRDNVVYPELHFPLDYHVGPDGTLPTNHPENTTKFSPDSIAWYIRSIPYVDHILTNGLKVYDSGGTFIHISDRQALPAWANQQPFIGGNFIIQGSMSWVDDPDGILTLITMADSNNPRPNEGKVTLKSGAELKNVIIFADTIEIEPNETDHDVINTAILIARHIKFPDPSKMKHNITFNRFPDNERIRAHFPVLLQDFLLPGSKESP